MEIQRLVICGESMVKFFDLTKLNPNDVISFCPHKYTFQECNDIDKCEFYNLHSGCVPYDLQFLWG